MRILSCCCSRFPYHPSVYARLSGRQAVLSQSLVQRRCVDARHRAQHALPPAIGLLGGGAQPVQAGGVGTAGRQRGPVQPCQQQARMCHVPDIGRAVCHPDRHRGAVIVLPVCRSVKDQQNQQSQNDDQTDPRRLDIRPEAIRRSVSGGPGRRAGALPVFSCDGHHRLSSWMMKRPPLQLY
ncbi:hypothetical protein GDI2431 [Gluconacetobacter diazotrophicus PA1 5]|uniref:Uncharacterized protein n=1 Tax=Gluconacetobacter diazotrophicus (strain ATCC 49037 / DSM 5601 / CCUG 37298 / CIP 103539 / LMG 7603 / PAl5) TaxID=272568 RepID=A9HN02_GLUDA|nr:hypothetical protein GDI2431 [Gluconacetobacter diazotrophicus PA1 5]